MYAAWKEVKSNLPNLQASHFPLYVSAKWAAEHPEGKPIMDTAVNVRRKLYIWCIEDCCYSLKSHCDPWSTPAVPWSPSSRGRSSRSSLFMRQHLLPVFTSVQSNPKYFCHCDTSFSLDSTSCLLYVDVAVVYIPCWQFLNTSALIPMCFPILSTFTVMCRDSTTCRFSSSWEEM